MKVLFLTEHGKGIGYGHLNRCTALADAFSEFNCEITTISRGSPGEYIFDRDYDYINEEWVRQPFLEEILPAFDITVIDSYRVPETILKYIGKHANTPVYLIDSTLKFYPVGTVLFPSVYADSYEFNEYPQLDIFKGIKYLLFTREFWNIKKPKPVKKLRHVGISLGGIADDAVINILSILSKFLPDTGEITLFGELGNNVERKIPLDQCNLRGFLPKKQYVEEIREMDVMICNGGQTLNECLLLGIPTISLICAENQKKNATAWQQLGVTASMDVWSEWKEFEFREKLQMVASYPYRKDIRKKCVSVIDHKGAIRSAEKIIENTTNKV